MLDPEPAIVRRSGRAVQEHGHRSYGGRAALVRDVVTLDPGRTLRQVQRLPQFVQRPRRALFVADPLVTDLAQPLLGVDPGQVEQLAPVAALRLFDRHAALPAAFRPALAQVRRHRRVVLRRERHQHLVWQVGRGLVVLGQEPVQHLGVGRLPRPPERELLAGYHPTPADDHQHDDGVPLVPRQADRVAVDRLGVDGLLAFEQRLQAADLIPEPSGVLVPLSPRGRRHLAAELLQDLVRVAVQYPHDSLDVPPVVLVGDMPVLRRRTESEVVVQTRPFPIRVVAMVVRHAIREDPPQRLQGLPDGPAARIRTEVPGFLVLGVPGGGHARPALVGDLDKLVALVVAQHHVVRRPVVLDEIRFGQQRLDLGPRDDPVHVGDLAD